MNCKQNTVFNEKTQANFIFYLIYQSKKLLFKGCARSSEHPSHTWLHASSPDKYPALSLGPSVRAQDPPVGLGFKAGFVRVGRAVNMFRGLCFFIWEKQKFLPLSKKMCWEDISKKCPISWHLFWWVCLVRGGWHSRNLNPFEKICIFRISRAGCNSCPDGFARLILLHICLKFHISRLQSSMEAWLSGITLFY